jgi:hypothetical protein
MSVDMSFPSSDVISARRTPYCSNAFEFTTSMVNYAIYVYLTSATTPPVVPVTTSQPCDDVIGDCAHLDQIVGFCSKSEQAAVTCRKYCNLCDSHACKLTSMQGVYYIILLMQFYYYKLLIHEFYNLPREEM